jgi:hypothetical protein
VSQPDTSPILENNYCLQIVETGFAEQFYVSYRMGPCTNLCDHFREISLKRDLSNDTTVNPPLFSLVNTFKQCLFSGYPLYHICSVCWSLVRPPWQVKFIFLLLFYNCTVLFTLTLSLFYNNCCVCVSSWQS